MVRSPISPCFRRERKAGSSSLFPKACIPPIQRRPQSLLLLDLIEGALHLRFGVFHDRHDFDVILQRVFKAHHLEGLVNRLLGQADVLRSDFENAAGQLVSCFLERLV